MPQYQPRSVRGASGGIFPSPRYRSAGAQLAPPPQPPVQVPLLIPKNLVLLSMIEATEEQRCKALPLSKDDDEENEENNKHAILPPEGRRRRSSRVSIPDEVDVSIAHARRGSSREDDDDDEEDLTTAPSASSDLGDDDAFKNPATQGNSFEEDDDDDEELDDETQGKRELDRVLKSVETMTGSCGTYAVKEKQGLIVLPKDPRKKRHRQLQRQLQHYQKPYHKPTKELVDDAAVLKESSSANCSVSYCSSSSSVEPPPRGDSTSKTQQQQRGSGGSKDLTTLRMRKRRLEEIIQRRRQAGSPSLASINSAPTRTALSQKQKEEDSTRRSEEPEEAHSHHSISRRRVFGTKDSIAAVAGGIPRTNSSGSRSWTKLRSGDRRGRSPDRSAVSRHRRRSPRPPPSITKTASALGAAPPLVTQEPFRIKYGQTVQAVSFVDGVVTLARNQGFILATHSQLVKVKPATDESCRLEGLLETLARDGRALESKARANSNLCRALYHKIQVVQQRSEDHAVVSETSSQVSLNAATAEEKEEERALVSPETASKQTVEARDTNQPEDHESPPLALTSSADPTDTQAAPVPQTPPTQLIQPLLRTPTAPNRMHPTTSIGGLMGLATTTPPQQHQVTPDTPKTIDNSDLDQAHRNSDDNLSLMPPLSNTTTRQTPVVDNDQVDITFGCVTNLLSTGFMSESTDPVVRDLFLPFPRTNDDTNPQTSSSSSILPSHNNNNTEDEDGNGRRTQSHPQLPSTPSTPRTTISGRVNTTPGSTTSTLIPVLQPISSFDSAINFRTGLSGHSGLVVSSLKKNKAHYSPQASNHHPTNSNTPNHPHAQNNHHNSNQYYSNGQPRRRIRMMGEHRGLGFRIDMRQAMSSWGITTSHNHT